MFVSCVEVTFFYRFPYVFVAFVRRSEVQGNSHPTQRQCPVGLKVVRWLRRYALVPSKTLGKVIFVAYKWHSVREVYQLAGPNLASFPTSGGSAPPTFLVLFPNVSTTCFYNTGNVFVGSHLISFYRFPAPGPPKQKPYKNPHNVFVFS